MNAITGRLEGALTGRYRLDGELDTGGMAVVYAARDLRHDRKVAIKVFRPELSAVLGAERFTAEIRISANLQHPHILPLFDSGSAEGLLYYVMPLVDGESLRARLKREKQLSIADAVSIATQAASALEYAHQHGVIHRDIKPENILLQGGEVLVADFGIALALEQSGGSRLTETGLSLGTPHYMSPEQATGERALDWRTDIYSLGVVLYEMLAGEPPYTGPTVQAIVAKILTERPRMLAAMRPSTPPHVAAAVEKALARIPADRFAHAHELAAALSAATSLDLRATPEGIAFSELARRTLGRVVSEAATLVASPLRAVLVAAAVALGVWMGASVFRGAAPPGPGGSVRFAVPTQSVQLDRSLGQLPMIALSPDGRSLVFAQNGKLAVRRLDSFEFRVLPNTEDATTPAFSPDGRWLVFGQAGRLRKTLVEGGPVVDIVTANYRLGAFWAEDNDIYFSAGLGDRGIWRVRSSGGVPDSVTVLRDSLGEQAHGWPQLLPGGKDLLFTVVGPSGGAEDSRIVVETIGRGRRKTLVEHATYGRFVSPGEILYGTLGGTVFAVPYDVKRQTITGNPVAVVDGVSVAVWGGATLFATSEGGTFAFVPGLPSEFHVMQLVDRQGRVIRQIGPPRNIWGPQFSPDGNRIAVTVREPGKNDVWLFSTQRDDVERFTLAIAEDEMPVWSRDGQRVAYVSARSGGAHPLLVKSVAARTDPQPLRTWARHIHPTSWSPDGKWLAAYDYHPIHNEDVWAVGIQGTDSIAIAVTAARELNAVFSPDGKWLAYQSDESGRFEVYVVSFPAPSAKRQLSTNGGTVPRWDRAGAALYFLENGRLVTVPISTAAGLEVRAAPTTLFATTAFDYDVTQDGQRFLLALSNPNAPASTIRVIANATGEYHTPSNARRQ